MVGAGAAEIAEQNSPVRFDADMATPRGPATAGSAAARSVTATTRGSHATLNGVINVSLLD
jgi:hypothetical protein